jgi:cellulose synthase/poly-beta-1,6-N-acetylglucosamine synthase-like glycosyltransferase
MFDLLRIAYLACLLLLTLYACSGAMLFLIYLLRRHLTSDASTNERGFVDEANLPTVCVQLPVYNEAHVVERLIDAAARLDYPPALLTIQILDDSTDQTTARAAARAALWRARGVSIAHLHRADRAGFKAGALAHGLAQTDAELIAIFDADFMPPPGALRAAVAHLVAFPDAGMVQMRWGHLNADTRPLTRALALALDAHFAIEQTARAAGGLLLNFNGSGGVWRARAIREAGGWRDTTLTEDLDLSYRAQLTGWRLAYRPDLVVPGEIPESLAAYRQQQARWARGGSQVFALLIGRVWRANGLTLIQRLAATAHLAQYLVQALILFMVVCAPLLIAAGALPAADLGVLGLVGLVPPLMIAAGQRALYPDWARRLAFGLPVLVMTTAGMTWCCARAALSGLVSRGGEFRRTPKRGDASRTGEKVRAALPIAEGALSLYCAFGAGVAAWRAPGLIGYLLLYALAFGGMALMLHRERRRA